MANPQKENGYTMIANELVEAMARHDFGYSKGQIFFAIIRLTYGWHKKEDKISISQICTLTNLSKRTVIYTLQNLEAQKKLIIVRTSKNREKQINNISIQKDYDQWNDNSFALPYLKLKEQAKIRSAKEYKPMVVVQKNTELVVQNKDKNINSFAHTKETIPKKQYTKETNIASKDADKRNFHLEIQELFDYFKSEFAKKITAEEKPTFSWGRCEKQAKEFLKESTLEKMKKMIDAYFDSNDKFYKENYWSLQLFLSANTIHKLKIKTKI